MMSILSGKIDQIILETKRMWLLEANPEIYEFIFTNCTDREIMVFFGLNDAGQLETERDKYEKGMTTYRMSFKSFLLMEKTTELIIGRSGFHNWYGIHNRAELGYAITNNLFLRQGYMLEAVKTIVDYGFRQMHLHRVEAFTSPTNIASRTILSRLGFKEEGIKREDWLIDGEYDDSVCYGLLNREYFESNPL